MAKQSKNTHKKSANSAKPYERDPRREKPISDAYYVIGNDLARDNLENDIPDADLQDL